MNFTFVLVCMCLIMFCWPPAQATTPDDISPREVIDKFELDSGQVAYLQWLGPYVNRLTQAEDTLWALYHFAGGLWRGYPKDDKVPDTSVDSIPDWMRYKALCKIVGDTLSALDEEIEPRPGYKPPFARPFTQVRDNLYRRVNVLLAWSRSMNFCFAERNATQAFSGCVAERSSLSLSSLPPTRILQELGWDTERLTKKP